MTPYSSAVLCMLATVQNGPCSPLAGFLRVGRGEGVLFYPPCGHWVVLQNKKLSSNVRQH